jgi:hypothetical protein
MACVARWAICTTMHVWFWAIDRVKDSKSHLNRGKTAWHDACFLLDSETVETVGHEECNLREQRS